MTADTGLILGVAGFAGLAITILLFWNARLHKVEPARADFDQFAGELAAQQQRFLAVIEQLAEQHNTTALKALDTLPAVVQTVGSEIRQVVSPTPYPFPAMPSLEADTGYAEGVRDWTDELVGLSDDELGREAVPPPPIGFEVRGE